MSRLRARPYFWLLCLLLLLGAGLHHSASASGADELELVLEWPNEGETLYAGPTSLLYKVPIKGYVRSEHVAPEAITVRLDVLHGDRLVGSLHKQATATGEFSFFVTVNPDGSLQEFTIGFRDCGERCHSEGEMGLEPGRLRLQVTATAPGGAQVSIARTITVDLAGIATVPVAVTLAASPGEPVAGVQVTAATRVYLWRARFGSGVTDSSGQATVRVEALSQAATGYRLSVSPTVVDGVLYRGVDTVDVSLPPGAVDAPAVMLAVTAHRGQLAGTVVGTGGSAAEALTAYAICLPDGQAFTSSVDGSGTFAFADLPVERYEVTVAGPVSDGAPLAAGSQVDLAEHLEAGVLLTLAETPGTVAAGDVRAADGWLPFAWATTADATVSAATLPATGSYRLAGLPAAATTATIYAPGYYAQVLHLEPGGNAGTVVLQPQPETTTLPWGQGSLTLPAQSDLVRRGNQITLARGWLWGHDGDDSTWQIETPAATIEVGAGDFALEYLPGRRAWFYLFSGSANLVADSRAGRITLTSGQMVNLLNEEGLKAVAYDPVVVRTLRNAPDAPISPVWEQGLGARVRDRLARLGIGLAQIITFVTYLLILSSLLIAPLMLLYFRYRRRRASHPHA